jgi:DNA-binding cell septation regulator SpoVG
MSEVFTNLKVTPLKNKESSTKASGIVTVSNVLEVRFTISSGKNGLWVKLPQHSFQFKNKETGKEETKYVRDVKIVDEELYKSFQELVIAEYNRIEGGGASQERPARDNRNF